MFDKRFKITLLFNANKVYDRQVIKGIGDYLQASQCDWDIFLEEDFRCRISKLQHWVGDGIIADFDDPEIEQALKQVLVLLNPIIEILQGTENTMQIAMKIPADQITENDGYFGWDFSDFDGTVNATVSAVAFQFSPQGSIFIVR